MKGDKTQCPNCNNKFDIEFLDANIGKLVKCTYCKYPSLVRLRESGYLSVNRLNRATKSYNLLNIVEPPLEKLMNQMVYNHIKFVKGTFHDQHKLEFFRSGRLKWVQEARSKMIFEAKAFGISNGLIKKFFQKNGGQIYKETINYHFNN
jgi:DNA-directed RNA polymerase subunit RPC12/RpoP